MSMSFVGLGVEIDHVARFLRRLSAAVHRDGHVGLSERGGVVGAVAGHSNHVALGLILANRLELGFGRRLGDEVVHARLGRDGRCGKRIVARDHNRLDAHGAQVGEILLDSPASRCP